MTARWRDRLFGWLGSFVSRCALWIVITAVLLAAASIIYTATHWRFQSNRNLLISRKLEWNRWFMDIKDQFSGSADLVVVIDAGPDAAKAGTDAYREARAVAEELGQAFQQSPRVEKVVWSLEFAPRALRLAPMKEFKERMAQASESGVVLQSPTPQALMTNLSQGMMAAGSPESLNDAEIAGKIGELARLIEAMGTVMAAPAGQNVDFGALVSGSQERGQYLTSANGRLLFVRLTPKLDKEELDALLPALEEIRTIMRKAGETHPNVQIGITGIEVMEADETTAATWDSTWTAALATVLIAALLILAFHSWRTPLFAIAALLIGIAWAYGFLFLVVGHLQVLSVVFNIMLLGLGIAYAIYLASAFELLRHDFPDDPEGFRMTLVRTFQVMGPGIFIGAFTTAFAFATTIFTDFTGVAEMGLIAGVGILLCLTAIFFIFPALLRLFKSSRAQVVSMESRYIHFFEERWITPFVRHPVATLMVAAMLTVLSAAAVWQMRFDFDLLKLQPRNAPSLRWAERVVRDGGQSIWYGLSVAGDMETVQERTAAFRKLSTVDTVGGVGLLFPEDDAEKVQIIQEARTKLGTALDPAPEPSSSTPADEPDLLEQLSGFRDLMRMAAIAKLPPPMTQAINELGQVLDRVLNSGENWSPEERQMRVERLRQEYARWRNNLVRQIGQLMDPSPLKFDDLPTELLGSYRDANGRLLLEVYPSLTRDEQFAHLHPASPLDPRFLPVFVRQMESVDPKITGVVPQIYRSGILIKRSYEIAGLLALLIVFVIVYFDYGSLHDALLILLPVAIAFLITFGLMWLIDMKINAANIIVLPLMFGIGVDSGVHVLNRYGQNPTDTQTGLTRGTGKGITITCMTSVISFAAMMLSSHRGIASLGFVLATGLTMTMFACWTIMPAWLELRLRYKRKRGLPIVPTR